jgi:hypothetical protein
MTLLQTILRNCAIPAYLCPLSFQKIRNLGGKFGENLAEQFKVATIGELLYVTSCYGFIICALTRNPRSVTQGVSRTASVAAVDLPIIQRKCKRSSVGTVCGSTTSFVALIDRKVCVYSASL